MSAKVRTVISPLLQFPHPQHPKQRQPIPGVDPSFAGGAEQVGRPGHPQDFGAAFDAVELFNGEAAGGGEALENALAEELVVPVAGVGGIEGAVEFFNEGGHRIFRGGFKN